MLREASAAGESSKPGEADQRARSSAVPTIRQWFGVPVSEDTEVARAGADRNRADRSWQALAERHEPSRSTESRDECLSMEWFRNRVDAKIIIESWRRHYNEAAFEPGKISRRAEFKRQLSTTSPQRAIF